VAAERLAHGDVQVVEVRPAGMVALQPGQHWLVPVGVKNAVEDGMVAVVQGVTHNLVYQAYVDAARSVLFVKDLPPDQVL
jgi:hypothetical protein